MTAMHFEFSVGSKPPSSNRPLSADLKPSIFSFPTTMQFLALFGIVLRMQMQQQLPAGGAILFFWHGKSVAEVGLRLE